MVVIPPASLCSASVARIGTDDRIRSAIRSRFPVDIICLRGLRDNRCRTTQRWLRHGAPGIPSTPWWEAEMATEPKNPRLTERHRQVLEVLAISPHGRDVNGLLTLGFKQIGRASCRERV